MQTLIIFCQTVVCAASVCSDWDSLYLRFEYHNIFLTLLIFHLYLSSWNMHISLWVYSDWISIHIKRLYCMITPWQSVPKFCNTVISFGRLYTQYKQLPSHVYPQVISLQIILAWEVKGYPWIFQCENIVLWTLRFLDVAKFTSCNTSVINIFI